MRLFNKLLLFNLLGKGILLLLFLMSGPLIFRYLILRNTDAELQQKKEQVEEIILENGIQSFISDDEPDAGYGSYNILKEEYILLEKVDKGFALVTEYVTEKRIIEEEEISYRVFAEVISVEGQDYLLEIGKSLKTIEEIEYLFFQISIAILILFLVFSALLDSGISRVIMKPFDRIIRTKITQINEPQQFQDESIPSTTREFVILDQAISEMMKRIQKSFNQERIFISHASHELKTPISVLQSKLEMLFEEEELTEKQQGKLMEMQQTIQKMKKSVNALLLLSKVNNAQFLKKENVSMVELIEELVEDWEGIAANQGLLLRLDRLDQFNFEKTNASLLSMMIQNSISNAIRYSFSGSEIVLSGELISDGYRIRVTNEGDPIDPQVLEQVREGQVFLKDASRESSGFGLQIMFKIALFLGVQLELTSIDQQNQVEFIFLKKN